MNDVIEWRNEWRKRKKRKKKVRVAFAGQFYFAITCKAIERKHIHELLVSFSWKSVRKDDGFTSI